MHEDVGVYWKFNTNHKCYTRSATGNRTDVVMITTKTEELIMIRVVKKSKLQRRKGNLEAMKTNKL